MFDNVIVGVADPEAGRDAIALATQLSARRARLTLAEVNVLLTPDPAPGAVSLAAERGRAMRRLTSLRDESSVDAQVLCVEARSVAKGLHELALGRHADLLVIGASRRDEYERTLVGDDTTAVLDSAPCPVAVAPMGYATRPPLRKIAAAYDGSPQSERALAVARELALERGAELSAFQAVSEPVRVRDPWNPQPEIDEGVAKARQRIPGSGGLEAHAASGDAHEVLARYGTSVDLLLLGSHDYQSIHHVLWGSTAQRLANRARCALLVLSRSRTPAGVDNH